jgi:hypothetical protein
MLGDPPLVAALVKAGIIKALVPTLYTDSPFRVAAAAGVLGCLPQIQGGYAAIEASGAVPALIKLIRERRVTAISPQQLQKEPAVFQRYGEWLDVSRCITHDIYGNHSCIICSDTHTCRCPRMIHPHTPIGGAGGVSKVRGVARREPNCLRSCIYRSC